jgi:ATP phosphoribosyltransferase regulatory subunit
MGVFSEILGGASESQSFKRLALKLISEKNTHELSALCDEYLLSEENKNCVMGLVGLYGRADKVLTGLRALMKDIDNSPAYTELSKICALLSKTEYYDRINVDFSVLNDMNYYNGILFKGFVSGICESVLSGGEYMPLIERMNKRGSGVGFAIYLDSLSLLCDVSEYDFDVMLVYSDKTDAEELLLKKEELISGGLSVVTVLSADSPYKCRETIYLD